MKNVVKFNYVFFPKQECPKKGHAHFYAILYNSPENGKRFFPKTRIPVLGTSACPKVARPSPFFGKSFFPKTRIPVLETVARWLCTFWHYGHTFTKMIFKYLKPYMIS